MKKRLLAALVASAAVLSLAGCNNDSGSSSSSSSSSSSAGGGNESSSTVSQSSEAQPAADVKDDDPTLTILCWAGNGDIDNLVNYFCDTNGISKDNVKVVNTGADSGGTARENYQNYIRNTSDDCDLMIMDNEWTQLYANDDTLTAPYTDLGFTVDQFKAKAYPYTIDFGTSQNGIFKAGSFQCTPGAYLYNSKLAKEYLGVNSPEEMQEKVKDWDTYKATAATVLAASGNKTAMSPTVSGLWEVYKCYRTKPWVVNGKLEMDTAPDFFDLAKELVDNKYCANIDAWNAGWYGSLTDGTALGEFLPTWALVPSDAGQVKNFAGGGDSFDDFALCEGPAPWYWGGSFFGLSPRCNTKATAKLWIETFCLDDAKMKGYAEKTMDYMNNRGVMKQIIDAKTTKNPYLGGQDHYAIFAKTGENLNMAGLFTSFDSALKEEVSNAVTKHYLQGESKEATIDAFKTAAAGIGGFTVE